MSVTPQAQEWPPRVGESWRDLEYFGCFYCDRPWDHDINPADGSIYMCLDCYERRYNKDPSGQQVGEKPE